MRFVSDDGLLTETGISDLISEVEDVDGSQATDLLKAELDASQEVSALEEPL